MKTNVPDIEFIKEWNAVIAYLQKLFGKIPDLNGVLFIIGVQELGKGVQNFSKEQKQDLMHIATCKLLSPLGYYELEGVDQEGWPLWKQLKPLPKLDLKEQEKLLKMQAIEYFQDIINA